MLTVSAQAQQAAVTLKLGTLAPEGTIWDKIMRDMGDQWKASGLKLQFYPGGVLGDEPDMVSKMRIGQIRVGVLTVDLSVAHLAAHVRFVAEDTAGINLQLHARRFPLISHVPHD